MRYEVAELTDVRRDHRPPGGHVVIQLHGQPALVGASIAQWQPADVAGAQMKVEGLY